MTQFFILTVAITFCRGGLAEQLHIYVTWEGVEPDKIASAWLIKKFVDPQAQFKFVPKGEAITEGIDFDVPASKFKRNHQYTTFEMIRRHYNIVDPAVLRMSKIIHDLEINTWGNPLADETPRFKQVLFDLDQHYPSKRIPMACLNAVYENLYLSLNNSSAEMNSSSLPKVCIHARL